MTPSHSPVRKPLTVRELFESRARATPHAPAARDTLQTVTYRELNERANRLARRLEQRGIAREQLVAVMTDPSVDMLVATLGVIKAGATYVALEPTWPSAMLVATLADTSARVLVTSSGAPAALRHVAGEIIALDDDPPSSRVTSIGPPDTAATPDHLFSVVYTSGTSGNPKGVLIPESAVLNRLSWMWSAHPHRPGDISLLFRSHAAIGFTWDCFGPLLQGALVLIAPPAAVRDPRDLVATCLAGGVTHVSASAGRWEAIVEHLEQRATEWRALRFARCSGEPMAPGLIARWRRVLPHAALLNVYGASECSSTAAYDTATFSGSTRVPVGPAVPNVSIYVVDEALGPVTPGQSGEVCVGGACVARGYLNRPALTAERFLPDPFSARPGARMFRTGDMGVYRPDVGLDIVGRRDRQVKIRGFRVELEEVEAALRACPFVREAAVVAEGYRPGDTRLVAYVVTDEGWEWSPRQLRALLSERVPDHMLPAEFTQLQHLARTSTGKIAHARLRASAPPPEPPPPPPSTPSLTPTESSIAAIWRTVLDRERIDIDEHFFDLGGDSLKAMQVLSRIYGTLGVEVGLEDLLDRPTVRALAATIDSAQHAEGLAAGILKGMRAEVRHIVVSLAPPAGALADDESFFTTEAIDSLTFLSILREVEQRFSVPLFGGDVILSDLSTIQQIAEHVASRAQPAAVVSTAETLHD